MTAPEGGAPATGAQASAQLQTSDPNATALALDFACNELARSQPHASIRGGLYESQRWGLWSFFGALAAFAYAAPEDFVSASAIALSLLFATVILLRIAAAIYALLRSKPIDHQTTTPADLPVVTVLIPLFREANVVAALLDAISKLNYPANLLDVKLLLEADDPETVAAVNAHSLPPHFEVLILPPCLPRTKPKALNFGLTRARGAIVCVFDAEDRPAPDQIRHAVEAFAQADEYLAVVQAPLLTHNGRASWIAGQFELEYTANFLVWLPFIERMGWPIPLGGTSNYFRRDWLEQVGAWDPWNVTEDADLGFRLARHGGRAEMIYPPTMEEGVQRIEHWMTQRTRWMKGHLQTWLVLMRDPIEVVRQLGLARFIGLQLTFGASLVTALAHLPLVAFVAIGLVHPDIELEGWHATLFGVGYGSVVGAILATREVRLDFWRLITLPVYWPLMSIAMYRALLEMKTRPHAWAKTPHGVGQQRPV